MINDFLEAFIENLTEGDIAEYIDDIGEKSLLIGKKYIEKYFGEMRKGEIFIWYDFNYKTLFIAFDRNTYFERYLGDSFLRHKFGALRWHIQEKQFTDSILNLCLTGK